MRESPRGLRGRVTFRPNAKTPTDASTALGVRERLHAPAWPRGTLGRTETDAERKGAAMTTIIFTGLPTVHAHLTYHRRLGRYLLQLGSDGVTVEFLLSGEEARRLLTEVGGLAAEVASAPPGSGSPGSEDAASEGAASEGAVSTEEAR